MKLLRQFILLAGIVLAAVGCDKDEPAIDTEYPVIEAASPGTFPIQCGTLKRGQAFTFKATFSDNIALGSYSLYINALRSLHFTELIRFIPFCRLDDFVLFLLLFFL